MRITSKITCLIIVISCLAFVRCNEATGTSREFSSAIAPLPESKTVVHQHALLSTDDADKILGEKSHLADSASSGKDGVLLQYRCSYKADGEEKSSGKTGNLYFLFEQFQGEAAASKKFDFIRKANESHGIKDIHDLGDQAYFHTDNENFYFIMVRKGDRVFNMKVNKITANTSLDAFNSVARKVAETI